MDWSKACWLASAVAGSTGLGVTRNDNPDEERDGKCRMIHTDVSIIGHERFISNFSVLILFTGIRLLSYIHEIVNTIWPILHMLNKVTGSELKSLQTVTLPWGTAPGHWFFREAREFSRPISAKSVFRQPGFPWNYSTGSLYHMTLYVDVHGCGWACACARHNAKISLFCASKSSLTTSYFRLIVSNLLSLHVQLPQTKAAFPAPKYCDISPSETIVCRRIGECKQNQRRKGRFERARLIGCSNTRKMRSTWWSFGCGKSLFGLKQYELG